MILLLLSTLLHASPSDCAPCHKAETTNFGQAGMMRAPEPATSEILRANPKLSARIGGYSYRFEQAAYTVSDGKDTLRVHIGWSFGQGVAGQTWLFQHDPQTALSFRIADEMPRFRGQCHRSWSDIWLKGSRGIPNVACRRIGRQAASAKMPPAAASAARHASPGSSRNAPTVYRSPGQRGEGQ